MFKGKKNNIKILTHINYGRNHYNGCSEYSYPTTLSEW